MFRFPISDALQKGAFWHYQQLLFDFSFLSLIVVKRFPFIGAFSFGKSENQRLPKEYGSLGMFTVEFLAKNQCTSIDI